MLGIYIAGVVISFSIALAIIIRIPPKDNKEIVQDAVFMLLCMVFWPVLLMVLILALVIKWVCE